MGYTIYSLACAQAGLIVGEAQRVAALGHACEPPTALPAHRPATVAQGIAYAVVSYLLAVICCEQVAPFSIAVGVGSSRSAAADRAVARAGVLRAA